ncbi:MAG: aminotransferase class I/II-fold pyridoxal phosphate-dependent enzyme, partial [Candidatus Marinimicrobia bacterium]|nr:aminotransferase class I/II-fold pyridoxal phosphate-dependent enzyme [Candidatus Neomarinimicrobiota bacterium]
IVIDEAYIDFSDTPSWNRKIATFPNLIVLQTFSKAWGMAGIRLGMAFSNTEVIAVLNKIKYPYNINDVTANIVLETIKYPERKEKMVKQIKVERQRLMKELKDIPVVKDVLPSVANFFLARFDDPDAVYTYLSREGIIVRNRSRQLHCEGCLRITVGTREENSILCDALMQYKNKEQ